MLRKGKYRAGLAERLGRVPRRLQTAPKGQSIWVHAVSVGEVLAVAGLIRELRSRFHVAWAGVVAAASGAARAATSSDEPAAHGCGEG